MAPKIPFRLARYDVPHANGAIITPRNQGATAGSQSTHCMCMTFQLQSMIRIFLHILLQNEVVLVDRADNAYSTDLRRITIGILCPVVVILLFPRFG